MEILIVGNSVRAAAYCARRAGLVPFAVDRFADEDLAAICPTRQDPHYPRGLVAQAASFPATVWMYTGALENFPEVIDTMSQGRALFGNSSSVVRRVRDPWRVHESLTRRKIPSPALLRTRQPPPGGQWLRKPLRSGGGTGIHFAHETSLAPSTGAETHYYQQYLPGRTLGIVFLGNARRAAFVGITQHLVGTSWAGTGRFAYAGSIGPLQLTAEQFQQAKQIGDALAEDFGLVGLFGVDTVLHCDQLWPIEINPRFTASVEIHERACDIRTIAQHVAACSRGDLPPDTVKPADRYIGKAIVYATSTHRVPAAFSDWVRRENADQDWPRIADVPFSGTETIAGHPICSVFAEGTSVASVEARLRELAANVHARTCHPPQ